MSDENVGGLVELLPCPGCGRSDIDQWPCEWLDKSGANVARCAWCHFAAPIKAWNRRALSAHGQPVVDGRYFADGPQGWFVTDNPELARALVNAYDNGDDWTVTDIGYVAGALG